MAGQQFVPGTLLHPQHHWLNLIKNIVINIGLMRKQEKITLPLFKLRMSLHPLVWQLEQTGMVLELLQQLVDQESL